MYQNIYYSKKNNKLHLWDDKLGYRSFSYKKYAFIKSSTGDFMSLDGHKVKRVTKWDEDDISRGIIYESDLNPELRTLIDLYSDSDEASINHNVMILDIEVAKEKGYCTPKEASNTITAITYYDSLLKKYFTFILNKSGDIKSSDSADKELIACRDEADLLSKFLSYYVNSKPTIITGWNSDFFDIPYLYNRITLVLGKDYADALSPINEVRETFSSFGDQQRYKIAGVSCLDYMSLYKNFVQNEQASYALAAISQKELGRSKIQYDGDLDSLYKNDINKFIEYNIVDVELIVALDDKLKFLDLARGICHKGHVPYEDIYFTNRYLDGAAITYMKRLGIVAPNKGQSSMTEEEYLDSEGSIQGAYVKDPIPGRYQWIFDLDMTSLYPSIIMSQNISPETKMGKVINWSPEDYIRNIEKEYIVQIGSKEQKLNRVEFAKLLSESKYSIASNGVLYRTDKRGFLPTILEAWFQERVEFKALMKKYHNAGDMAMYHYFNARQNVQKILLNSFYGVLALPTFRFYNNDNAEAITLGGQSVLKFSQKMGNAYFSKTIGVDKDYCIYCDTDSVFFSALPIIQAQEPNIDLSNENLLLEKTSNIATEVQKFINSSFSIYAEKFHNIKEHKFSIKQEMIAKTGIWVAKKRYAQKIVLKEGLSVNELDIKGIDVVRSSFPKAFREFMKLILDDILSFISKEIVDDKILAFKETMKKCNIYDIMSPTGVKDISKWDSGETFGTKMKGTPVHVKASMNYNNLLKHLNINDRPPITNGDKIKWAYLKPNSYGMDNLALTGYEDPKEIMKIVEDNIDYERIFEKLLENKLQDFYTALNWQNIPKNKNLANFFEF